MTTTFTVICRGAKYEVTIDDCDADLLSSSRYKWSGIRNTHDRNVYVKRNAYDGKKVSAEMLHRLILERVLGRQLGRYEFVDHKDTNSLNNQRNNLRLATPSQNNANVGRSSVNASGYKGVCWDKREKKWIACITFEGKKHRLGAFDIPEQAHAAYALKAIELHGEFARLD